ncbi:MAG: T9SS type A sorting domain-containing protein [Porphyromonadaceae bacterium]|nr:T9SS type A sorting domain-containing protein [Porphyromonadaceae bacterium]
MRKFNFLKMMLLAVVMMAGSGTWGQVIILEEDFSSIITGNNTTTGGSGTGWSGNDNFPTINRTYQAGGAVKLGTSSAIGSIESKSMDLSVNGGNFSISFDVKGWTSVEGSINVTVSGITPQTVIYSATMSDTFETKELHFSGGTANSTVTIATTAKRAFIDNVKVYYEDLNATAAPTFSPEAGTYTSAQNVELTSETAGASIYYTTDGTDPNNTGNGTLYVGTTPINVTTTTTIKAIAYADGLEPSAIATATYTFPPSVANIAEFLATTETGNVIISGPVTVVYQNGQNMYIQDSSGSLLVYGNVGKTFTNGDVLSGLMGTLGTYGGAAQMTSPVAPDAVSGTAIEPTVFDLSTVNTADLAKYVKVENVQFTADVTFSTSSTVNGTLVNPADFTVRDNFRLGGSVLAAKKYDIVGFISYYNGDPQLFPVLITELASTEPLIIATPTSLDFGVVEIGGTVDAKTITVTSENLTGEITATLSGTDMAQFSVIPTSLSTTGGEISVTYTPSDATATHSATLTLSSTGASDVVVSLAAETKESPLILNANETFETQEVLTASYLDGEFDGETEGVVVKYVHSRNAGTYSINEKGIMLRRADEPSYVEFVIPNGVGEFSFNYRKAFTGAGERIIAVVVNGEEKYITPGFGAASGEETDVYKFSDIINKVGTVTVRLTYPEGTANGNRQLVIDNVKWSSYGVSSAQNGNWNDPTTWSGGAVPQVTDIAISHHVTIPTEYAAHAANLTIQPNGSLTIIEGGAIEFASLKLLSDETGTATVIGEVFMEAEVNQHLTRSGETYAISSPVASGLYSGVAYTYNASASPSAYEEVTFTEENPMTLGLGYAVQPSGTTLQFTGTLNNGEVSIPIHYNGNTSDKYRGWNLIGNPYPSALNWNTVWANESNQSKIKSSIWYNFGTAAAYNAAGGIGVPEDANGIIAPMQGFWVVASDDASSTTPTSESITLDNNMRTHTELSYNNLLRAPKKSQNQVIRLQATNGTNTDEMVLYFNENAADTYDNYDTRKMMGTSSPKLYTLLETMPMLINGMSAIPHNTEITLAFQADATGSYTIKSTEFSNFAEGEKVILKDKVKGIETDLTASEYEFTADAGTNLTRFSLILPKSDIPSSVDQNFTDDMQLIMADGKLHILLPSYTDGTHAYVYNNVGQLIASQRLQGTANSLNKQLSSGVYIVKVEAGKHVQTQKLIVK